MGALYFGHRIEKVCFRGVKRITDSEQSFRSRRGHRLCRERVTARRLEGAVDREGARASPCQGCSSGFSAPPRPALPPAPPSWTWPAWTGNPAPPGQCRGHSACRAALVHSFSTPSGVHSPRSPASRVQVPRHPPQVWVVMKGHLSKPTLASCLPGRRLSRMDSVPMGTSC